MTFYIAMTCIPISMVNNSHIAYEGNNAKTLCISFGLRRANSESVLLNPNEITKRSGVVYYSLLMEGTIRNYL